MAVKQQTSRKRRIAQELKAVIVPYERRATPEEEAARIRLVARMIYKLIKLEQQAALQAEGVSHE